MPFRRRETSGRRVRGSQPGAVVFIGGIQQAVDFVLRLLPAAENEKVDPLGNIQIGDRVRDMVKSGGEWISSVDLETALIARPSVLEAAVIAISHPTWQERPLACVVANAEYRDSL